MGKREIETWNYEINDHDDLKYSLDIVRGSLSALAVALPDSRSYNNELLANVFDVHGIALTFISKNANKANLKSKELERLVIKAKAKSKKFKKR